MDYDLKGVSFFYSYLLVLSLNSGVLIIKLISKQKETEIPVAKMKK